MAENTKIEWCDHTFNAWTGCTKVGPGCDGCYAEAWAKRSGTVRWGSGEPRRRTTPANWRLPVKWNAQAAAEGRRFRVFCSSLADVFDNEVPPEWRVDLFALIRATPHLDWLLLTKRVGNVRPMLQAVASDLKGARTLLDNVWLGITVVNQAEADRDIPKLLAVPARVRFLSIEPMLGPVDITPFLWGKHEAVDTICQNCPRDVDCMCGYHTRAELKLSSVGWVICGGESGPKARPMHPDWARSLRDQCAAAGVPFLFKQWGEWAPDEHFTRLPASDDAIHEWGDGQAITGRSWRYGKKAAGRLLDGRTHDGFPEVAP